MLDAELEKYTDQNQTSEDTKSLKEIQEKIDFLISNKEPITIHMNDLTVCSGYSCGYDTGVHGYFNDWEQGSTSDLASVLKWCIK